ncbi:LL-diaminopimelate aminotransferase [Rubellicoccus peritrichatus]|uniref:Aminotransferase n=1 Tax=Rubellicoccus peritrichatus TaxID=3080537 RepID=A0AAQ3LCE7_9BACT|nr:LL-diaminopimelate aminotransferase [Puniceicoccus sp. CR14]WOO42792.1 LL-diaminopimelate aminotransferase [Puniceicoccus sp. CR14]
MADESYIQQLFAERIGGSNYGKSTAIYKFEKIKRAKIAAKAEKPDVDLIDMGVGEPDEMAFPEVVQTLQEEAAKPENRGYADNGGAEYKQAVADYMQKIFGVELDPDTEVLHSIGSKAALSIIPACFINPDDYVLMTTPGYPVFGTHAQYFGGKVYNYQLSAENAFLPDLDSAPADALEKAKVLVINYPNNPTGASATIEFYEKVVAFAKQHNLIVLQDAAYSALIFEGKPISILQVPGGKDVAVELHSLSKGFNMTGWRIGWVCGNPLIVKAYGDLKDNSDSGQFLAIQKAAAAALGNPGITEAIATKYSRRMDMLVEVLRASGFNAVKPKGSFFLYTAAPKSATKPDGSKVEFSSGEDFSQFLIRELLISTVPWDDAGSFVRFSVTFAAKGEDAEKEVVTEIGKRLGDYSFSF